jgi:S-disulfanyl-L-cysteine oxidoreductase SoxD
MGSRKLVAFVPLLVLLGSPAFAQSSPTYGVGRTPTAAEIRRLDISLSPTGDELPAGRGTAKEGAEVFEQAGCISCHGETGIGGPAPALRSKKADNVPIWERERILPLRAPFATIVWDFIHRGMPLGNEGSLSADETYALTAYLLVLNKVIPEDTVLDSGFVSISKMPTPETSNTGERGSPVFELRPSHPATAGSDSTAFEVQKAPRMIAPRKTKTAQIATTLSFKAMSMRGAPWPLSMNRVYQKNQGRPEVSILQCSSGRYGCALHVM